MYIRKWKKGRALTVMEALEAVATRKPVYWHDKWTHPGWSGSWQINMVVSAARGNHIFEAIRVGEDQPL